MCFLHLILIWNSTVCVDSPCRSELNIGHTIVVRAYFYRARTKYPIDWWSSPYKFTLTITTSHQLLIEIAIWEMSNALNQWIKSWPKTLWEWDRYWIYQNYIEHILNSQWIYLFSCENVRQHNIQKIMVWRKTFQTSFFLWLK